MTTIIETDVQTYTNEVEYCQRRLRSCHPKDEPYWEARLVAAQAAVAALETLQGLILMRQRDQAPPPIDSN